MNKYGFDLEIMNVIANAEDILARLTDNIKSNEITYKDFIGKRLETMKALENKIKIEISDLELLESDLK